MVSISSKIGMLTMLSTMALGRELTGLPIPTDPSAVAAKLLELEEQILMIASKQIVRDEFYINDWEITVRRNGP